MSALSTFEQVELQKKLDQSSKEIERLNALVAMQAEALKDIATYAHKTDEVVRWANEALSASSSTVAKWEAERDEKMITRFKRELSCIQHVEKLAGREINRLCATKQVKE